MRDETGRAERAPLIHRSTSLRPIYPEDEEAEKGISTLRGTCIIASIGLLIFLQGKMNFLVVILCCLLGNITYHDLIYTSETNQTTATNISILTTTQSSIAEDLDAFDKATWLTSSYLIAMSSLAPLMGRLSQVFSPRLCMFFSTLLICVGTTITALSVSFNMFLVGRAFTGAGGGGILIVASIIVIQMTPPKRRGLYIGLVNSGMTVGVSLGAVIAGGLEPKIGWVRISVYLSTWYDTHA